jgi:hypothetical protein
VGSGIGTRQLVQDGAPAPDTDGGSGPHELMFEQAMARIATLAAAWTESRDGLVNAGAATAPAAATTVVLPLQDSGTADALSARSEAPRWRRSLAS